MVNLKMEFPEFCFIQNFLMDSQYILTWKHKQKIIDTEKNQSSYQFKVGYTTNPYLRLHLIMKEEIINMFSTGFFKNTL